MNVHTSAIHTQPVDATLSIAPQLAPDDIAAVAAAGFRSIVNNRPDFEGGPTQPTSAELEAAARNCGLEYRHHPVPPAGHTDAQARAMVDLVDALPQPVLAFCRTGKRSAALYQKGKTLPGGTQ
jgi:uncharacterized protein (TIGR01244 family)